MWLNDYPRYGGPPINPPPESDCPYGVGWCDGDHLCEDCAGDLCDRVYEEEKDRRMEEQWRKNNKD